MVYQGGDTAGRVVPDVVGMADMVALDADKDMEDEGVAALDVDAEMGTVATRNVLVARIHGTLYNHAHAHDLAARQNTDHRGR